MNILIDVLELLKWTLKSQREKSQILKFWVFHLTNPFLIDSKDILERKKTLMIILIIIGDATDLMIMGGVSLSLFLDSRILRL